MKEKVYISGQMTGIEGYNAFEFNKATDLLRGQGINCVNPFEIGRTIEHKLDSCTIEEKYFMYMKADIAVLLDCTHIYLLKGWEKSKGAKMEKQIADFFNIKTINEGDELCF